jgi:hypothetical protein
LSTSKLADADYVTLFTKDEVCVFDTEAAKFKVEGEVVMRGWRCPETKLWRIQLKPQVTNNNTDTALMSQRTTNIMMERRKEWMIINGCLGFIWPMEVMLVWICG